MSNTAGRTSPSRINVFRTRKNPVTLQVDASSKALGIGILLVQIYSSRTAHGNTITKFPFIGNLDYLTANKVVKVTRILFSADQYGFKVVTSSLMRPVITPLPKPLTTTSPLPTSLKANLESPAELLNDRRYRTTLPTKMPATQSGKTRENMTFKQDAQICHCNQHACPSPRPN